MVMDFDGQGGSAEDILDRAFFAFVIFTAISVAVRSSFWADRVVFGAIAYALALIIIRTVSLRADAMFALDFVQVLMWTIAACVGRNA